jgi:hypothetical protein
MSTTISTQTAAITTVERTYCVERQTPSDGKYRLLVHREVIKTLPDGTVISRQAIPEAVNDLVAETMLRACTRDYLAACQRARTPADLMAAEAKWYDDLVAELRAEKAAAAAAEAAGQNG